MVILQENFLDVLFGNSASISLFIIFLVCFLLGTLLIYHQVSLVLKGEFKLKERLQCIIFGIIFSLAVMIVMSMAFIFAVKTPEFWVNSTVPAPYIDPFYMIFPFIVCLLYISIYPLIDFLFIAISDESDEGMTPFHKILGETIIKRSPNKIIRVIYAIGFYIIVFFLPPFLLSQLGLPFIIIWISWMLVYPLMILTFYGSKGYIAGITYFYYHIPDMRRSLFLGFEDGKRTMKEFTRDPAPRILIGLMIFVYVWAWISMFQTIGFYFSGALLISPYSYAGMVFVTLLFGIIGYFTRFWSRKIKFSPIHIYFAAYLIAAVGINVFVNFVIVNADKLSETFSVLNLTDSLVSNYLMFAWAAAIEEIILLIFTSYYFLAKRSDYSNNLKMSLITQSGQTFDPIPLFNFIKSKNPNIRKHAEETLILMYERIPLKTDIKLNDMKYKNPLIDGISDPHPNSERICYNILLQLQKDVPDLILPWIIDSLRSPNYDKTIPFARSLIEADMHLLTKIPENEIFSLINDSEWRLKLIGLKILSRLVKSNENLISRLNLSKLLYDPDSQVQVEVLNILAKSSTTISSALINDKIDHSNREIRAAAIKNIKNIDIENIDLEMISKLKSLIKDPTSSVRASVFETLAKIGNFKSLNIPLLPFLNGLIDLNKNVRDASVLVLEKYFNEEPGSLNINLIINKIDPNNNEILNSVLSLLGRLWDNSPERILTTLLVFIKFDNEDLKDNISKIIVDKYKTNPKLIIKNLIKVPDVSKFITKGIISRTLIRIAKNYPNDVIPLLIEFLNDKNNDIRFNAISSIEGIADEYYNKINVE
ncbi:MAG: HEAT repeat domain-containing protein, partial [Promethearchaeota archaeon]